MTDAQPNMFNRGDTFFGVCQALGEDIGIHSNWLRLAFAGAFFFAPMPVVAGYLGLGLIVALVRWIAPVPQSAIVSSASDDASVEAGPALAPAAGLFGTDRSATTPAYAAEDQSADEPEALPLAA